MDNMINMRGAEGMFCESRAGVIMQIITSSASAFWRAINTNSADVMEGNTQYIIRVLTI